MRLRLRLRHAVLSSAISLICSIGLAPPAHAQSFFQKLFGFGGSGGAPAPAVNAPGRPLPAYRFQYRSERRYQSRPNDAYDDEIGPPDSGGPYRTMCVRACDGFYFPLRHNAQRRNFSADIKSCRAACGDEARLYYYAEHGGSPELMVDLAGRPYKQMPNAFAYRKALVTGCTCKAAPWSFEEASRHRSYAEAARNEERERSSKLETTAANVAAAPDAKSPDPAAQPAPPAATDTPPAATIESAAAASVESAAVASVETYEPVPAPNVRQAREPRRTGRVYRRKTRATLSTARYSPGYATQMFAPSKSKYVWPGDRR